MTTTGFLRGISMGVFWVFLFCCATSSLAQPQSEGRKKLRIAIPNFKYVTGSPRYSSFSRALPELIQVGLINERNFEVIPRSEFWQTSARIYPAHSGRSLLPFLYSDEVLKELRVNLIIDGRYSEFEGRVQLDAKIVDRHSPESYRVEGEQARTDDFVSGFSRFLINIRNTLPNFKDKKALIRIGFRCFTNDSDARYIWLSADIPRTIMALTTLTPTLVMEPWSTSGDPCGKNESDLWSSIPNVIVSGRFSVSQNASSIELFIESPNDGSKVAISKRTAAEDEFLKVQENLAKDLSLALAGLERSGFGLNNTLRLISENAPASNLSTAFEIFESIIESRRENESELLTLAAIFANSVLQNGKLGRSALQLMIEIRLLQDRVEDSMDMIRIALARYKNAPEFRVLESRVEIANGRFESAEEIANALLENDDFVDQARFLKGSIAFLEGRYQDSIKELEAIKRPDSELQTKIAKLLAASYSSLGETSKALSELTSIGKGERLQSGIDSQLTNEVISQVQQLASNGENQKALDLVEQYGDVLLETESVLWRLIFLNRMRRYDESFRLFKENEQNAKTADISVLAGVAARELGELSEARKLFEYTLAMKPNSTRALMELAKLEEESGNVFKAVSILHEALEIDQNDYRLLTALAQTLKRSKSFHESLKQVEKALEIAPNNPSALHVKASVLNDLNQHKEAAEVYRTLVNLESQNFVAWSNLSWTYLQLGDWFKASETAQIALKGKSDYAPALKNGGLALVKIGTVDRGLEFLHRAVELRPTYSWALYFYALALKEVGNEKEAAAFFDRAGVVDERFRTVDLEASPPVLKFN